MKLLLGAVLLIALVTGGYSLVCHRCNSLPGSCASNTTIACNRTLHETCRSISINDISGGIGQSILLSGCGSCFGLISFNTGRLSRYLQTSCCSSSLCNDDVKPEIENSTLNGLECLGCLAVNGTCTNLLSIVKCKGQQDRCAHTSGLLQGVFLTTYELKGCVSDFICRNPNNALGFYGINPTIGFYCCKDNLCNLESRNFTKTDPTASPSSDPTQLNASTTNPSSDPTQNSISTPIATMTLSAGPTQLNASIDNTTASNSGPTQLNASIGSALLLVCLKLVL